MDLSTDAMLVSLRISAWSGRLHDRRASNHVAAHHEASAGAGRYNKRLLPKSAFAALTATAGKARTTHYGQTLPWDDQGFRLLPVANYDDYTTRMDRLRERMVRERARFMADYDEQIEQARLELGRLFRAEEYPDRESLRDRFAIAYRITPVSGPEHFMAKLASDDTDRVRRDIEKRIADRLNHAVGDLYRRFGEAIERVSDRLRDDGEGKPLVFRNSMIGNLRDLVDLAPKLNIFGDDNLARLCGDVKEKIASVEPDTLRLSRQFDPVARARVKREADELLERFSGYFGAPEDGLASDSRQEPEPERQAPEQREAA